MLLLAAVGAAVVVVLALARSGEKGTSTRPAPSSRPHRRATRAPRLHATHCFEDPGEQARSTARIERCGYPGYASTGPETGVALTEDSRWKGELAILGPEDRYGEGVWTVKDNSPSVKLSDSQTIEGRRIRGNVKVAESATQAVIRNDEILTEGLGCPASAKPACAGNYSAAAITNAGQNTLISHTFAGGTAKTGINVVSECVASGGNGSNPEGGAHLRIEYGRFLNCDGVKLDDGGTVEHSYCLDNAEISSSEGSAHYECVSMNCSNVPQQDEPLVLKANTFFNPHKETSAIFVQGTHGPCHEVRIYANFLAGGDETLSAGLETTGPVLIDKNRFAFATCASGEKIISGGNHVCAEQEESAGHEQQLTPLTPGGTGYFPNSGSYRYASHVIHGAHPTGNFRDDDLAELPFTEEPPDSGGQ